MLDYTISDSKPVSYKLEQLKYIGLTPLEYQTLSGVISCSYLSTTEENFRISQKLCSCTHTSEGMNSHAMLPLSTTYDISKVNLQQYNMVNFDNRSFSGSQGYKTINDWNFMKNSSGISQNYRSNLNYNDYRFSMGTKPVKFIKPSISSVDKSNKIFILKNVLEGIHDDTQILLTSKPKNKSQKIRKSNRHSRYRGVSLNGKKWQVMIMGPIHKKYFGGIGTEREAAIFYDKLSIMTNGLTAKTNFNYRKCDLIKMMAELEYMQSITSESDTNK
jgi:hypothetical protein